MAVNTMQSFGTISSLYPIAEYTFQQIPYIVSPRRQVNVTAVVSRPLTLGPIVVKNLNVDNVFGNGAWCQRGVAEVGRCCEFEVINKGLLPSGTVKTTSCAGALEEWTLQRSLDCENGMVEYSLFNNDFRETDFGEYVFTINNSYHTFHFTTVVEACPSAAQDQGVIIAVVVSVVFGLLVAVVVIVLVLICCSIVMLRRKVDRQRVELLREAMAQEGEVAEPVVAGGCIVRGKCCAVCKLYIRTCES